MLLCGWGHVGANGKALFGVGKMGVASCIYKKKGASIIPNTVDGRNPAPPGMYKTL